VLGGLVAILTGYLLHRWLQGQRGNRLQRLIERLTIVAVAVASIWLAETTIGAAIVARVLVTGICFALAAVAVLLFARGRSALAATVLLGAFTAADLAYNNAPHESTGLPSARYEVLRFDTRNETIALIKQRLAAPPQNHRDRVELIGIAYFWPNICLIHDCEHVFGHNPLRLKWFFDATRAQDTVATPSQRIFSPLYPSYRSPFADLLGVRLIATGVPVEEIDRSLKPGDLTLLAHTRDAYVYENPRALPRVMMLGDWRLVAHEKLVSDGWPADVDPAKTVLLEKVPPVPPLSSFEAAGSARLARYTNNEVVIEADSPSGGTLVLTDVWHPWWFATIDGSETEIFRADAIFRAVQLPPGRHTVRFTFAPLRGAWQELREKLR